MTDQPDGRAGGGLNRQTWNRLRHQIHRFLASGDGRRARRLLLLLTAGMLLINGLNVLVSYVGRDFMSAIEHRDPAAFLRWGWISIGVFALLSLSGALNRYMEERLGLLWRSWQTRRLLDRYLSDHTYSRIESRGDLPNPDQRIAEDVRTFTTTTLSFLLLTLNATITICSFSGVLWSVSPRLFMVGVAYAVAGSIATVLVGRRLIGLNIRQLDCEANLRSELMHVRDNADAIALEHREEQQRRHLQRRLEQLVDNTRAMISVNLDLGIFTNGYNYLIQIIPALLVAPLFMRGEVEFGVVTQSAMAFAFLTNAFSLVVTQFQSISSYTAVVARLGQLGDSLERARSQPRSTLELREAGDSLRYEHLDLKRADGASLLKDLNLAVGRGSNLLVASNSGHAKVALFRATAGLEGSASGRIIRPDAGAFLFVPEQPYLPRGSLREVLALAPAGDTAGDAGLLDVLHRLGLDKVLADAGGLDAERDWSTFTGVGERTRLSLARVLLARPLFVFIDRMKLAMDSAQLADVVDILSARGITCIALGKPGDPAARFDAVLEIGDDGSWSLKRA